MVEKIREGSQDELLLSLGLLVRRLRSAGHSKAQGLSWTQMSVIARLAKEGPATTADLARAESVKPQSMGTIVTTLEKIGLVERKPHPTDGRQVYIHLSAKGNAVRKSTRDAKHTWLAQAISKLDEREQKTLLAAGTIIKRLVEL